jgi:hypothetical protein
MEADMLVANYYVKVNGEVYMRGEQIPDDIPDIKKDWLISSGAVSETAEGPEKAEEEPSSDDGPDIGMPKPEPEDEADEAGEAPEIDAIAGIVAPKKTRARRKRQ